MLSLLAALALAAPAPGPSLRPPPHAAVDIPAPASLERDTVVAWMQAYVQGEHWTLLAYDREGVKLTAPGGVRRTPDGLAEADVRTELFRPIRVSAGVARSGLARWAVDCMAGRLAVTRMTIFAGNNLEGELASRVSDQRTWQDPVGAEAEAIQAVCKAVGK
ncbi:MAG TPA: surface-adhesin E family protein [Phenylobacterium sp.]|uniref:surface-adhesin E family protein n=1 Tax=Phenylobacterium sp. TaxID=1871053 RepID=UPI002B6052D7|nr:surface-adhesin E family protein [Phenylobacterium sp.]HSV02535.1 surface-adhesin E family protein [Phenylobacterium sp.]